MNESPNSVRRICKKWYVQECQNLKHCSIAPSSECDISSILVSDKVGPIEWNEGRRIIGLVTIAHNLGKCTAEGCEAYKI